MRAAPMLLVRVEDWYCPNCPVTDRTVGLPANAARYHKCRGLHDLNAPLVPAGVSAKVTAEERQDYLGGDLQALGDNGIAYMAVRTTRNDGEDLLVNAGLARAVLTA